jgi:predicted RNase H-like HicB family nuclease
VKTKSKKRSYVLCINNEEYPASLEVRKIYKCLPDPEAEAHGQIRVIDETGEDYLYPQELFLPIEIPEKAIRAIARAM